MGAALKVGLGWGAGLLFRLQLLFPVPETFPSARLGCALRTWHPQLKTLCSQQWS